MKTIVLFHPRTLHENNYRNYHIPYSILAIATILDRKKYNIILIDDNDQKKESYEDVLKSNKNSLLCVGISSMIGAQITYAMKFAKEVRNLNIKVPIIWGGPLATILPEQLIENEYVDILIMGQGERIFSNILKYLDGELSIEHIKGIAYKSGCSCVINQRVELENINNFPAYKTVYDLLDLEHYIRNDEHISSRVLSYHSSQGCPFKCGYCAEVSLWNRKWYGYNVERIIGDIDYLIEKYHVNGIKFYDSEFFIDKKRALEFASYLIDNNYHISWAASAHPQSINRLSDDELEMLRRSGLKRLLIGAESGSEEELKLIGKDSNKKIIMNVAKRCEQKNIYVCFTFVTGYPTMPSKNIEDAFDFVYELHDFTPMHEVKLHFYGPYPGTPLYNLALDNGFVPPDSLLGWAKHDYYNILTPWIDEKYSKKLREINETLYPYISPNGKERKQELREIVSIEIIPPAPFDFNLTVNKCSHFPTKDCKFIEDKYYFTTVYEDKAIIVKLTNIGTVKIPSILLSVYSYENISDNICKKIISEIQWRFGLNEDLKDFYHKYSSDSILGPIIKRNMGMRVKTQQSLYEFIIVSFVLQNATVRRSVQMMDNLLERYGTKTKIDNIELYLPWKVSDLNNVTEDELKELKVGYRAKSILRATEVGNSSYFREETLRRLPYDELRERILSIYGIGPASAGYILFEVFRRYDALEFISPWELKIYNKILFQDDHSRTSDEIIKFARERWDRWCMLALHYIFEDLFTQHKQCKIQWLDDFIKL